MTPLAALFALSALTNLDNRAIMVLLPAVADSYAVTPGVAGYGVTAYAVTYGALQLAFGPLTDRYGRLRVVRMAGIGFVAGTALTGLAPSLATFVAARFLTGVFAAAMVSTTFAYIGDTVGYARRPAVIGHFNATLATAQVVALTASGAIAHVATWRLVFAAVAAIGGAALLALARRAEAPVTAHAVETLSYRAILAMPSVRQVCGAVLVEGAFAFAGMSYFAVIARARYGVNDLEAGLLLGCFGAGAALTSLCLGRIAARLGEHGLARAGGAALALGWLALGFGPTHRLAPLVFAVLGAGWIGLHATLQTRATELASEARGKAMALFAVSLFAGVAIGAAIIGWLLDRGAVEAVALACAIGLAGVGAWVSLQRAGAEGATRRAG